MLERKVNVAMLVSGGGTNLQAILDAINNGVITRAVVSVVISNNPNAYALIRAKNAGIDAIAIDKRGEKLTVSDFEERIKRVLIDKKTDLIVLAGFLCVLSKDFCDTYKNRIINVHPSLIPKFCGNGFYGLKVHEAVLAAKETVTGATVHFVSDIVDGGDIILQKQVKVNASDTAESLQQRVMKEAEWIILPQAMEIISKKIIKGEI